MEPVYRGVIGAAVSVFALKRWRVHVRGAEHVPETGAAILASTHVGYLDFIVVGYAVRAATRDKRLVRFAAKQEIFDHKVSGPLMRAMGHIPVDRGGGGAAAIDRGVELLSRGELVGMFPEGTMSRSFVPLPIRGGTVRMAQRADVPILPVAVWGTQRLWTRGRRELRSDVDLTVDIGPPLPTEGEPAALTSQLQQTLTGMARQAALAYPSRPPEGAWWEPAELGGSAPSPQEARRSANERAAARRARRRAERD